MPLFNVTNSFRDRCDSKGQSQIWKRWSESDVTAGGFMDRMLKKVLLLRHGKTEANFEKRYIGSRTDIPLSDDGIKAIEDAAPVIREMAGDKIFLVASPMRRAVQTAGILFPYDRIHKKDNLREIDFGDFEGKNYEELNGNADYQKWIDSNGTLPFPNGEDRDGFIQRSISEFMSVVFESGEDETIVIICHGGNVMSIMSSLTGKDYYDFMIGNMDGYSLNLTMENERIVDLSYNCING